jgi:hypothetical protein
MKTLETTVGLMFAAAALATAGCGGEPEFAEQPVVDAGPEPPPPATTAEPTPPPPPPPAATNGPCDGVQTTAMSTMFVGRFPTEAPGMQPEGAMLCGVVAEGQSVESATFMLDPGHCYTVLGQGMPNVTDVDLQLVIDTQGLPPLLQAFAGKPVLAVDTVAGVTTAIQPGQNCYKWAAPISAVVKLVATAKAGSGPVAAQVYKKKSP